MNKVILMGRLTKDPDVRSSGNNTVGRYTLAVDRKYSKEKETDFINCVCFGKAAEFAEKYLKKGTKIAIVGRIQTGSYEKDGQKIYTTDVIIEEQDFAESKGSSNETSSSKGEGDFMEIPANSIDDMPF